MDRKYCIAFSFYYFPFSGRRWLQTESHRRMDIRIDDTPISFDGIGTAGWVGPMRQGTKPGIESNFMDW